MVIEFSKITGVSVESLLGTSQMRYISAMRQMYWRLLSERGFTREQIGAINGRNQSSITLGIKHINGLIETDIYLAELWEKVRLIKR